MGVSLKEKRKAKEYKVVLSQKLSKILGNRYVIMNKEETEILDDAGGYGYKTRQGALACYEWKRDVYDKRKEYADKNMAEEEWEAREYVREFCKENPKLIRDLQNLMFYRKKKNRPMSDEEIINFLNSQDIDFFPFTLKQLLKYW